MEKQMLLEDHIRKNKRETVIICMFMVALLFSVIFAIGFAFGLPPIFAMAIGLPIALAYIAITYSFSVSSVIAAAGARPANPQNREEKLLIYKASLYMDFAHKWKERKCAKIKRICCLYVWIDNLKR